MRYITFVAPEIVLALMMFGILPVPVQNSFLIALLYLLTNVWWFVFAALAYECGRQKTTKGWFAVFVTILSYIALLTVVLIPFTAVILLLSLDDIEVNLYGFIGLSALFLGRILISVLTTLYFHGSNHLRQQLGYVGGHLFQFQVPILALSLFAAPASLTYGGEVALSLYFGCVSILSAIAMIIFRFYKKPVFEYTSLH